MQKPFREVKVGEQFLRDYRGKILNLEDIVWWTRQKSVPNNAYNASHIRGTLKCQCYVPDDEMVELKPADDPPRQKVRITFKAQFSVDVEYVNDTEIWPRNLPGNLIQIPETEEVEYIPFTFEVMDGRRISKHGHTIGPNLFQDE